MLGIPRAGLRRSAAVLVAAATLTALTTTTSGAQAAPSAPTETYLVQTADAPVATYNGGVAGIAATRPATGRKIDTRAANVRAYRDHLADRRSDVLRRANVSAGKKVYDYALVMAGFSAELTAKEAERLRRTPGVANVWKNTLHTAQTFTTPEFIGLDGRRGAWREQFGDPRRAGEGVIVGVIDSGFWPENPSFGPLPTPRRDQAIIDAKWRGTCDTGVEGPISCNNKVIGARWYNAGGLSDANPGEYDSPRDFYGHGSHTASTAAGNHGVTATIQGSVAGVLSGMAPAARLSIYKVLYSNAAQTQSVGSAQDIVAAIDQAVADGVDVINYSVGDNNDGFGAIELSFLNAASAGVFIAASAGNNGPGSGTVDNGMPWLTTVAAGTHDRTSTKTVTLGDGRTFEGVGVGGAAPSAPLIDAANAGLPGANPTLAAQCVSNPPQLDPATVTGKIVLCVRGNNARVDKSAAVKNAGGVGMVLYNPTPNTLNADYHLVPSVHINEVAGAAVKAYAATAAPTAAISAPTVGRIQAPDGRHVLVPRPGRVQRRRPAQARHHGARRGRRRRHRAAEPLRQPVGHQQRHLDGQPAHRRRRRAADPEAPGLVADGGQVGHHDHGRRTGQRRRTDPRRARRPRRHPAGDGCRAGRRRRRVRPRPGLRRRPDAVAPVQLRDRRPPDRGRRPGRVRHRRHGRPERLQQPVAFGR